MKKRIFEKYIGNPILSPADMPEEVLYVFNPGVIKNKDGYVMVMDCTTIDDIHRLWVARSKDGYHFVPDSAPAKWPEPDMIHPETCTYDPRITYLDGVYYLVYASDLSQNKVRIGIVKTSDFETFERVSIASSLGNRNGCLFPEKMNGLYVRMDRPFGNEQDPSTIWLSYSPDLVYWGKSRPLTYQGAPFLDGYKMGAGAVPIKTEKGWLEIYHVVSQTCNGFIYRLKACLLDLEDPSKVIGYTRNFVLWPEHDYEMKGRVANVVFTCNAIPEEDGTIKIYYGAADTNIGLAVCNMQELMEQCI